MHFQLNTTSNHTLFLSLPISFRNTTELYIVHKVEYMLYLQSTEHSAGHIIVIFINIPAC